jgi:hypothetical protein
MSKLSCNDKSIFEPVPFDKHFDDHRKDLYPACLWALWEQIDPFLPDWVRSVLVKKMTTEESRSQTDGASTIG